MIWWIIVVTRDLKAKWKPNGSQTTEHTKKMLN